MKVDYTKKLKMPNKSGVYFFYKGKSLLYVGKATSLRDRVRSYLGKDLIATRGPLLVDMITQADSIKWQETDSVLEAIILEANLIKKYQPKYNTKEKDNKSFNYVCITKEELPKVLVIRGRNIKQKISDIKYKYLYGPFPNGLQLREAMKIIRRIFPYVDDQSSKKNNKVFYEQLKLTPESILQYKKNIINLNLFFQGKKKRIIQNFKKKMITYAKNKEFEKAGEIKKRIFALEHINDVALIKEDIMFTSQKNGFEKILRSLRDYTRPDNFQNYFSASFRIEAYDIAHMSGKNMVGVMIVVENNEPNKSEYKKFIIRTQESSNDTGALEEILSRRFRHAEWGIPNLIVVDGSTAQINVAKRVLNRYQFNISIVSVVKDDRHKAKAIIGDEQIIKQYKKSILLANSEAHRFAIAFHKQKRNKNFISTKSI